MERKQEQEFVCTSMCVWVCERERESRKIERHFCMQFSAQVCLVSLCYRILRLIIR